MSLEDLDSEFKSDESDYEAENNAEDDDEECSYGELLNLHLNLRRFQNIYTNNAIIDMEVRLLLINYLLFMNCFINKYSFNWQCMNDKPRD